MIKILDVTSGQLSSVTNGQVEAAHPTWSPDGSTISFVGYSLSGGAPGVYVVGADGAGLRRLTNDSDPDFTPSWQPTPAIVPVESVPGPAAAPAAPAAPATTPRPRHHRRRRYQTTLSRQIAPGVHWRRIVDHAGPNQISVLSVDTTKHVSIRTALANDHLGGFERVRSMARRHHAVAAINGDFGIGTGFHHHPGALGRPMHMFARGGSLDQSMFGVLWNFGLGARLGAGEVFSPANAMKAAQLGTPRTKIILGDLGTGLTSPVSRFNEGIPLGSGRPGWGEVEAYTRVASGLTNPPRFACSVRLIPAAPPKWAPSGDGVKRVYTVDRSACGTSSFPAKNGVVLSAIPTDQQAAVLRSLQPGDQASLRWTLGWGKTLDAVGGYPMLVRGGRRVATGCKSSFCYRNPRTAIGVTRGGRVLLVTVDGRRRTSVGMSLVEEAGLMRHLGAANAMNVDGGGSTTMVVKGRVVNVPSDGTDRAVSCAVLIVRRNLPSVPTPEGSARAATGASPSAWELAERDPGSTGGLIDALARAAGARSLPPALRVILRRYAAG